MRWRTANRANVWVAEMECGDPVCTFQKTASNQATETSTKRVMERITTKDTKSQELDEDVWENVVKESFEENLTGWGKQEERCSVLYGGVRHGCRLVPDAANSGSELKFEAICKIVRVA
jgi:hypothetical protein